MRTMEQMEGLLRRLWRTAREQTALILCRPEAETVMECALRFAVAAALPSAVLGENCAPFALGFVAASGAGPAGFCALVGAAVGYLTGVGIVSGLRYLSAAILTYAAAFACCDLAVYRSRWFLPACGAVTSAVTGVLYLSEGGWQSADTVRLLAEAGAIALSARLYRLALAPWLESGRRGKVSGPGLLFLGATLAAALARVALPGPLKLGTVLSGVAVLVLATRGQTETVTAGAVLGLALDLGAGVPGLHTAALTLGAVLARLGQGHGRLIAGLGLAGGGALAALWAAMLGTEFVPVAAALTLAAETTAAALVFLALPPGLLWGKARGRPAVREAAPLPFPDSPLLTKRQMQKRLNGQAEAFQTLYEDMRRGLHSPPVSEERMELVFDRAAEQVCQDCARCAICWKQDYHETYAAFHQMLTATQRRGYGRTEDAPAAFLARCGRVPELVSAANVEYASLMHRRQLDARLRTSRRAVWRQYAQLSQLLRRAAQELESDLMPDPEQSTPVIRFLRRHGLEAAVRLGRDGRGRLVLQLAGGDLSGVREGRLLDDLCRNMGVRLTAGPLERDRSGQRLTLVEEDRYRAVAGVAALSRDGQPVSGDGGSWFRDREGMLWVVLCDGMGSGPGAARQSRLALRLLEDFLKAGIGPELSLGTLAGALALRGESELGFTTIDLLGFDLFSGQGKSYKLGAAPTYLRQRGRVKKLSGSALPAGLDFGQENGPDVRSFQLGREDLAVMVSDGVSDGEEDDWLWQTIRDFRGKSPKELAAQVLERSSGGRDDRTVIVLQLKTRDKPDGNGPY